jgi:hypothetical protein
VNNELEVAARGRRGFRAARDSGELRKRKASKCIGNKEKSANIEIEIVVIKSINSGGTK